MNEKIDKLLKELALYYGDDTYKTSDSIYYFLTQYNIPKEEKQFDVYSLFSKWIDYFKDKPNIKVFNSPNWQYFCQFVNYPSNPELNDEIKIYLHINSKDIFEVARIIFEYLSINNIKHMSKIGSDIRLDDIVIRVYSKEDYLRIKNFIDRTPRIKDSLQDSFPIGFHDEKINLALDRDMSFNQVVSTYLYWYIRDNKKEGKEVSSRNFYNYLNNIYNQVFINKQNIDLFLRRFKNKNYTGLKEDQLNNYQEITKVILESLRDDTLENYFQTVDFCNDKDLLDERINGFIKLNNVNIEEHDCLLVKECIFVMYKKYGLETTITNLEIFMNTGNLSRITRDNDLRSRFTRSMSPTKLKNILNGKSMEMFVNETIYGVKEKDNPKEIFDKAIIETYKKYGLEQVTYAVKIAMDGIYNYFTNTNSARDNLKRQVTSEQIKDIVNGDTLTYINNTLQEYGIEMSKSR